ncbi:pre-toxin TG domain-containing protein [Streptosporangium roseum]|uniref:pre-toxin TG domain-containing protein n=1 Tax=Streptosporangium roseum TaxID=2001 RepID=UPI0033326CF0
MAGPSALERGTGDRGVTTDPDVAAIAAEERDLRQRIAASLRDESAPLVTLMAIRAQDAVNNAVPLRQVWATGEWESQRSRWIFLRHYLRYLSALGPSNAKSGPAISDAELVRQILNQEREYQRLARVDGRRWLIGGLERAEEQQYQQYLNLIQAIRNQQAHEQRLRPLRIHPAEVKSSIFLASGLMYGREEQVSFALDLIPIIGDIKAIAEAALGFNLITGRDLATWERGLNAGLSLLPFTRSIFRAGRAAVRGATVTGRYTLEHLAALAVRVGDRVDPRVLYNAMRSLSKVPKEALQVAARIPADRPLTAAQREGVGKVAAFSAEAMHVPPTTVSGVIDGGRATTRTASGEIAARRAVPTGPAVTTGRAAGAVGEAARSLSQAAQTLVAKGYAPEALEALESVGVRLTAQLVNKLDELGVVGRDFVNVFHRSTGFHLVVADLGYGTSKAKGAAFIMRYALAEADIMAKVRANPLLIMFERSVALRKNRDASARVVDIVVRGDRTLGVGDTIYLELKSWTRESLRRFMTTRGDKRRLPDVAESRQVQQLVRDSTTPGNIRWIFDSTKLNRKEALDAFVEVIQSDAYLTHVWGSDSNVIRAALENVIKLFP